MKVGKKSVSRTARYPLGNDCMREFSALGKLQCAHTLHYCIRETTDGWLLTLRKEAQEGSESETVRLLTSAEAVKALQIYLYENAVSLEVWQDVLADILPPEKIRPVENHETATEKKS